MPLHKDYKEANEFIQRFWELLPKALRGITSKERRKEITEDLWRVITNWGFETRMLNVLPKNYSEVDEIMEMGGMEWRNYKRSIRDMEWLEEKGQCMDNISKFQSHSIPDKSIQSLSSHLSYHIHRAWNLQHSKCWQRGLCNSFYSKGRFSVTCSLDPHQRQKGACHV